MKKDELRKAQLCQLEIAKEVKRICEKHDIKYFLAYGTMLGAVRHKGFIPWDDDMDIAFLRPEYDKFVEVCKNELSSDFFLQSYETDPYYTWPYVKLQKRGTIYKEAGVNEKTNNGIFIDILPIDSAEENRLSSFFKRVRYKYYLRMLQIKNGYENILNHGFLKKCFRLIILFFSHFYTIDKLKKKISDLLVQNRDDNSEYIHNINTPYKESKERMPREWFSEYITVDFEGESFTILKGYDKYLRHLYGNYMEPPPIDQRENRHQIIEIKT